MYCTTSSSIAVLYSSTVLAVILVRRLHLYSTTSSYRYTAIRADGTELPYRAYGRAYALYDTRTSMRYPSLFEYHYRAVVLLL